MSINEKFNYNEIYYEEVDKFWREWRRSVWDDSLGDTPQEAAGQIGPSGWVEVLDEDGAPIVEINGDGMTWAHADTHEDGGSDEINLQDLSGIPEQLQLHLDDTTDAHDASAVSIVDSGAYYTGTQVEAALQEIGADLAAAVTDHGALTGLADDDHPQYATNVEFDDHSARHENGGSDEISIDGLDGTPTELTNHVGAADPHTGYRLESADHSHASSGLQGGTVDHGALTGLSDDDHPQYATNVEFDDHSARHEDGGADEIEIANMATSETDTGLVLHPDGAGGVEWATDATGGGGASLDVHEAGVSVEDPVDTLDFGAGFDLTNPGAGEVEVALDLTEVSAFTDHSARHENGGADEISVAGLSGKLADPQPIEVYEDGVSVNTPNRLDFRDGFDITNVGGTEAEVTLDLLEVTTFTDHSARHENGGADEINLDGLEGLSLSLDVHQTAVADAHTASQVAIIDTGGFFTGAHVEAALQEIGTTNDFQDTTIAALEDITDELLMPPLVEAQLSGNQSISTGFGLTVLDLDSVNEADEAGVFSDNGAGVFTVAIAGWYEISAGVAFAAHSTGVRRIGIFYNGTTTTIAESMAAPGTSGIVGAVTVHRLYELGASDTIRIGVAQVSGGNLNALADSRTFLSIRRIRSN